MFPIVETSPAKSPFLILKSDVIVFEWKIKKRKNFEWDKFLSTSGLKLSDEQIVLWRWAKPSTFFHPTEDPHFNGVKFESHNKAVRAGLNPNDWMEIIRGEEDVFRGFWLCGQVA